MGNTRNKKKQNKKMIRFAICFAAIMLTAALTLMLLVQLDVLPLEKEKHPDGFWTDTQILRQDTELLGHGLELQGIGRFCGVYMEDGSMEPVSDVLMVRIKNTTDRDLQLADLSLDYGDFTAEFSITNLPAGRTVMVLEKNRKPFVDREYLNMSLSSVVFFQEQMALQTDRYQITGLDGVLNLKNISGNDITGDIYVYYKYTSTEDLYGGITFRVKIAGGIKAGEMRQTNAEHFDPESCIILAIESGV